MQQIKLFVGGEDGAPDLESRVNAWIAESGARVISVTGNIAPQSPDADGEPSPTLSKGRYAPSDILLVVLYETA